MGKLREGKTAIKTNHKHLAAILALVVGVLALTGCGGLGQDNGLRLANIGWDENVAVANLTKVLLEEEFDCEGVEIRSHDRVRTSAYTARQVGRIDQMAYLFRY